MLNTSLFREVVKKKNGYFTVRLTARGGGGGVTTPGLTVAFVKILGLKTHWIWFLDTQNTFYLMVKGLKNAYLMHFSSLHSWFHCRGCYYLKCSSSLSQSLCKGQIKGQKTFFGQNSFQLMYNHKPKSNALLRKNHKTADCKGWAYGQPDRKISGFFWRLPLIHLNQLFHLFQLIHLFHPIQLFHLIHIFHLLHLIHLFQREILQILEFS